VKVEDFGLRVIASVAVSWQMNHAAGGLAFHIYIWSFILISYMLLLNIFLSILVDTYMIAKSETPASVPIPEEVRPPHTLAPVP
jgi:hypothetical protein